MLSARVVRFVLCAVFFVSFACVEQQAQPQTPVEAASADAVVDDDSDMDTSGIGRPSASLSRPTAPGWSNPNYGTIWVPSTESVGANFSPLT